MKYTFGPVSSRRFGVSLGIDLSPEQKSCNFDCLYCELPKAQKTDYIKNPAPVEKIINDLKNALYLHPNTEIITITANGEPTLYPYLDKLINNLIEIKKGRKLLILSNSSTLINPNIKKSLQKLDIVKLSLDCISKECFKKIDRPLNISINEIIESIISFKKIFDGELIIEILLVCGINDNTREFEKFNKILQKINPDRIDIGTIDRPPSYDVKPVSFKKIEILCEALINLPVNIVTKKENTSLKTFYSEKEILLTFSKRAFTQEDIDKLFCEESKKILDSLVKQNKIEIIESNKCFFYSTKYPHKINTNI